MPGETENMNWKHIRTLLVVAMTACVLVGCGTPAGTNSSNSESDDHLEHHVPAHKPRSFAEAIDQIELRFARIRQTDPHQDSETSPIQYDELADIIDWLPELAADTDLNKIDWDYIYAVSQVLRSALDKRRQISRPPPEMEAAIDGFVARIASFVAHVGAPNSYDPHEAHDHSHAEHDHSHAEHDHAELADAGHDDDGHDHSRGDHSHASVDEPFTADAPDSGLPELSEK